ncbi:MAG: MBL fold metallo-hydrolase [Candidatus Saccharicenans sp.]|uniref:MBL fold metallo-hydrolase n=1 Tax=Candidatus Saccharicenans sp. TaxID=2819258 RepID=UPI00404A57FF
MKIVFLGTGGAVPTAVRDNTSFLLESGPELWLVDCPGSLAQKILRAGQQPQRISAIFISHVHADHLYGLPAFIHSLMLEEKTVPLFGSPETIDFCLRLIDLFGLRREKILFRLEPKPLLPGCRTEVSPRLSVTGWPVPHHSSSQAFIFETARAKVVYSGDTPIHRPLLEQAAGSDCLIHDCSTPSRYLEALPFLRSLHSNSLELGQAARETGIRLLVPCHFFSDLDFSLEEIEAEIRENFEGQLFLPADFSELELSL